MQFERERLDLASEPAAGNRNGAQGPASSGRPFLGVHFTCCDAYTRVYINREQTAYVGRCPRCCGQVRFAVGPDGTSARFFRAE